MSSKIIISLGRSKMVEVSTIIKHAYYKPHRNINIYFPQYFNHFSLISKIVSLYFPRTI